jgi:hypothetical protein
MQLPMEAIKQKSMQTITALQSQPNQDAPKMKTMDLINLYQLQEKVCYLANYLDSMKAMLIEMKTYHDLDEVENGEEITNCIELAEAHLEELAKPLINIGELLQSDIIVGGEK